MAQDRALRVTSTVMPPANIMKLLFVYVYSISRTYIQVVCRVNTLQATQFYNAFQPVRK